MTPRPTATGGAHYEGISFSLPTGYRPLQLDLHVPGGAGGPVPVVVWIHGGAFWSGDRRYLPDTMAAGSVFEALLDAGLAVATIDYRLSGEILFPGQLDDVLAALRYLRTFAGTLGLDPGRIGVWGESAGGTLAALAALTTQDISAAVLWYPLTDLSTVDPDSTDSPEARLIGGAPARLPEQAARASPVSHVSPSAPPFLLVHGTADTLLPAEQSERLHHSLLRAGARSEFVPVEGAGHCFADCDDITALITRSVDFLRGELAPRARTATDT
ncbi:alpha/beta hydrolase fold domain-containing protein [Streptomyces polygonati]|uniref:Alpha/beta hydrolase fold domain-containing protein n=1 Tax=Streptomyces polygonati TaxID=1617087 RepID=A0ABV8HTP8_9ACTN